MSGSSTFNRPEVRNAFDTAMYQEVTAALRAADSDEAVGAVVLTGHGSAFTSGQDLAEMAAIATGTAVGGAGQGFHWPARLPRRPLGPAPRRGERRRRRPRFHPPAPLQSRPRRLRRAPRVPFAELGVPPEAASSVLFPALMGWQRAAQVLLTSDWVRAPELVELASPSGCATRAPCSTRRSPWRAIAAHPRAATRASASLVRAARREAVLEANRREQAAFATLLGAAVGGGRLAEFAARPPTGS